MGFGFFPVNTRCFDFGLCIGKSNLANPKSNLYSNAIRIYDDLFRFNFVFISPATGNKITMYHIYCLLERELQRMTKAVMIEVLTGSFVTGSFNPDRGFCSLVTGPGISIN